MYEWSSLKCVVRRFCCLGLEAGGGSIHLWIWSFGYQCMGRKLLFLGVGS